MMARLLLGSICLLLMLNVAVASAADCPIPNNVRVVIGSTSTGGDTYQNASIVVRHLEKYLGVNMKVDAVGAIPAFRILSRSSSGNTLMIFHDQSYLGHLYGINGYPDLFKDYDVGPTISINPGNAYLVPKASPYKTVDDVINAAGNGKKVKIAIQPGGVSEIGFSAIKNAVKNEYPGEQKNIVAVNTGSQSDKNLLLFNGYADAIHGSIQANEQYTRLPADDQKSMHFIWLTAREKTLKKANPKGYGKMSRDEMLKYAAPDVAVPIDSNNDFTFDKEFFFIYNKDTSSDVEKCINNALKAIYEKGEIEKEYKKYFFIPDFLPQKEAVQHLKDKKEKYKKIIDNIK